MEHFRTTTGVEIEARTDRDLLKLEYVLQRYRDTWTLDSKWPYLQIDIDVVQQRLHQLTSFAVFSQATLHQNMRQRDFAQRMVGMLAGGGTTAGFGEESRTLVEGKANAKARFLQVWNPPLYVGTSLWCAEGTWIIYVDGDDWYQHSFGTLGTVNKRSRSSSPHFNFTELCDLRDTYLSNYFSRARSEVLNSEELSALGHLLDRIFELNASSLTAAKAYHDQRVATVVSNDYDAPRLTKYDRLTHDAGGQPKVELAFSLLHYEKALLEFNSIKSNQQTGREGAALIHGVYCMVAAAACLEAIANRLVFLQTAAHPTYQDRRTPLQKINGSALALAGAIYVPLVAGNPSFDQLDKLRVKRNGFMHAKELENDIDPQTLMSSVAVDVGEVACREVLRHLRLAVEHIYSFLPTMSKPIVTATNVTWMGDLEVP